MRAVTFALIFGLLCAAAMADEPREMSPEEMVREGRLLLEREKPAAALDMFRAALKAEPELIDAHRGCQDAMIALGMEAAVTEEYRERAERNPDSAAACYLYSRLVNDPAKERELLEKALKLDEGFAWAHYGIARMLSAGKEFEEAEAHLKRAIALRPGFIDACKALALLYIGQARTEEAKELYLKAIEQVPGETFARVAVAEIYLSEGKYDEALRHMNAAIALRGDRPDLYIRKAEILHGQKRREEAVEALRRVLDLDLSAADSTEAFNVSKKIATPEWGLNPADMEAYNAAAGKLQAGKFDGALKDLLPLLERKDDVALFHYEVGRIWQNKGDIPKAVEHLEKAITLAPDYAEPYCLMACIHYNLGAAQSNAQKAAEFKTLGEKFALHAVSLHPFYSSAYRLLAQICHDRGEYEKALHYAVIFYKIRRDYSEIRNFLIDEVRLDVGAEKPEAEFRIESFDVKVYPGRRQVGSHILLRFDVYKEGKIRKRFFAEAVPAGDKVGYYLCEVLDEANNTRDAFLDDEAPPTLRAYELAMREAIALDLLEE